MSTSSRRFIISASFSHPSAFLARSGPRWYSTSQRRLPTSPAGWGGEQDWVDLLYLLLGGYVHAFLLYRPHEPPLKTKCRAVEEERKGRLKHGASRGNDSDLRSLTFYSSVKADFTATTKLRAQHVTALFSGFPPRLA